jgi:hypothetical protein
MADLARGTLCQVDKTVSRFVNYYRERKSRTAGALSAIVASPTCTTTWLHGLPLTKGLTITRVDFCECLLKFFSVFAAHLLKV